MSFVVDAMEHLRVKKHGDENHAAVAATEMMRGQLAALASLVLLGDARIWNIKMVADGKAVPYSSGRIDDDFHQILVAMSEAEEFDFTISYDYWYSQGWEMCELMGPCVLRDHLAEWEKEELTGVFYSAWYHEDHVESEGILTAFGENKGKFYFGKVEPEEISEFPLGKWDALHTAILIDTEDDFDAAAHPELIKACEAFKEINGDVDLQVGDGLTFYLNNITIDSLENGKRFCDMTKELLTVLPDDCSILINAFFADQSGADAQLMIIDADEANDLVIKIARV